MYFTLGSTFRNNRKVAEIGLFGKGQNISKDGGIHYGSFMYYSVDWHGHVVLMKSLLIKKQIHI
ncbi:hypothetical protein CAEBREN_20608 [Caenorhabditis brenneri]|uniref:Uncharacterized protein n=1 Tax=Caenorhabditis brenneri TaxID=135651 RepID=G0NYZ7_CAEBE|nr:hypothetical protein CAEBREN_20608 [Caenorhabditis brenneri]